MLVSHLGASIPLAYMAIKKVFVCPHTEHAAGVLWQPYALEPLHARLWAEVPSSAHQSSRLHMSVRGELLCHRRLLRALLWSKPAPELPPCTARRLLQLSEKEAFLSNSIRILGHKNLTNQREEQGS